MPVFHFNIRRGDTGFEDREGVVLESVQKAMQHAVDDARAVMDSESEVRAADQWVEIADETGNTVGTVPFVTIAKSN